MSGALRAALLEVRLGGPDLEPWGQHRFAGAVVFPGVAYLDLMVRAAERLGGAWAVSELSLEQPLVLAADAPRVVAVSGLPAADGHEVEIESRPAGDAAAPPIRHARGRLVTAPDAASPPQDLAALRARCPLEVPAIDLYDAFARRGLDYGPAFRCVHGLWRAAGAEPTTVLARLEASGGAAAGCRLPPGLLDGCIQPMYCWLSDEASWLPGHVEQLEVHGAVADARWSFATRRPGRAGDDVVGDVLILGEAGTVLAKLSGVRLRRVAGAAADPARAAPAGPAGGASPALLALVHHEVLEVMQLPSGTELSPSDRLNELGVDSLLAIDLATALSKRLGRKVPRTLVFDHPTIEDIAVFLAAAGFAAPGA